MAEAAQQYDPFSSPIQDPQNDTYFDKDVYLCEITDKSKVARSGDPFINFRVLGRQSGETARINQHAGQVFHTLGGTTAVGRAYWRRKWDDMRRATGANHPDEMIAKQFLLRVSKAGFWESKEGRSFNANCSWSIRSADEFNTNKVAKLPTQTTEPDFEDDDIPF